MILQEFPDLRWLKQQVKHKFRYRRGWREAETPNPGWPSVVLNTQAQHVYRDNIAGPVSLFMNCRGNSLVTVENRTVRIADHSFFVTNQQQEYTLAIDELSPTETFNIHFGELFLEQLYHAEATQSSKLLDSPSNAAATSVNFYNRLHRKDEVVQRAIHRLQRVESEDLLLIEEILVDLAVHLLRLHQGDARKVRELPPVKAATRMEIYRRLRMAVDYIYSYYNHRLSLDELAEVAMLSKFHFLRLFKAAFCQTPHQFITKIRIEKAQELLRSSSQSLHSIAARVGLDNASSLSRLFRKHIGCYPSEYRNIGQK